MHCDGVNGSKYFQEETGRIGVASGAMQIYTDKKFGDGGLYSPTASHVSFPNHEDWHFGSGDFTVEFWYNQGNYFKVTTVMAFNIVGE